MSTRSKGVLARLAASIALVVVLVFATGAREATGAGTEAKPRCIGAGQAPKQATLHYLRSSTLCLVNRIRLHHGLDALHYNPQLRSSATGHSRDMVAHGYLAHDGPSGSTIGTRVASAGYLARVSTYFVGENIGGGAGQRAGSAMAVFRAWMQSPPHRANILDAGFHDFGVGVARGYPGGGGSAAATYTLDFGTRH